jgi:hypothetical protein
LDHKVKEENDDEEEKK